MSNESYLRPIFIDGSNVAREYFNFTFGFVGFLPKLTEWFEN